MKKLDLVTAAAFHAVLTVCLTGVSVYGVWQLLEAYPSADTWLGEKLGGWGGVVMIIAMCYVLGRTASLFFTKKCLLPWLRS